MSWTRTFAKPLFILMSCRPYIFVVGYYCALPVIVFTEMRQPRPARQTVHSQLTSSSVQQQQASAVSPDLEGRTQQQQQQEERTRRNGAPDACGYIGSASTC